jgi:hypothetical protein
MTCTYIGSLATNGVITQAEKAFQPTDPLSSESIYWVQLHISECLKSHPKCSNATETMLPKRVLSLRKTEEGSIEVSLRETNNGQGVYACLSHRWSDSESGRATCSSYADMLQGIAWETLPRTFQDAMQFALVLGIENIWIDSFCIIQDDPLDWQEQAAQMANIYQNSYITLAATASAKNEAGCFWGSDAAYERTFQGERALFSVRRVMKHWETSWASISAFPLLSRAWVFQERLLAPRVLHFSHNELVWECSELGDCQCRGYYAPSNPKTFDWKRKDSWVSAVELYTSLHLTIEEDRLPAFFGFVTFYAQSISASIETDYFAGLWRSSLHEDLLWRIDSSAQTLGLQTNRLCCCFDGTYSSDKNWRCQYSYSAACSLLCFDQRRFCRYGKEEAAVPYHMEFCGSCSGTNELTTIQKLRQLRAGVPLQHERKPYLGPSWSWASARTRVEYWKDMKKSERECTFGPIHASYNEKHLTGPMSSAMLTINGYITPALLQYEYIPERGVRHHNIFIYGLEIKEDQRRLDFYPDYILSLEGEKWIPPGIRVFLLHIAFGAHLVLIEKTFFELDLQARLSPSYSTSSIYANTGFKVHEKYVRIGIFKIPGDTTIRYEKTYFQSDIQLE